MKHPARSRFARTAFIGFLIIAAAIAAMASFTMFVTGTVLDSIWTTKEHTYHQLLQHKLPVGLGFAALAVILALAATGWTRHKRWGWLLGVLILAVNLLSDTVSLIASRQPADLLGVAIGAAILTWLLTPTARSYFT
jgi:glucan phosphoethanolaminetransferase (alkaline phosphatase superfamily)